MKERISALMDGELDAKSASQLVESLPQDQEALEAWRLYHVIGDALREGRVSAGVAGRVAARLAEEPTVMAPGALAPAAPRRWVALPIAASLAAVALVGWLALAPQQDPAAPAQPALAQAPTAAPVVPPAVAQVPLPRAARDYLLAHQGVSPRMSLQGMAPYARTVSHEVQEVRR